MADYQQKLEKLHEIGIEVAALSVDPKEDAREVVQDIGIEYPVLYDLDCVRISEKIGAYYDSDGEFFHATGFLLQNNRVKQLTYSSGPIGRLEVDDIAGLVKFYQSQED